MPRCLFAVAFAFAFRIATGKRYFSRHGVIERAPERIALHPADHPDEPNNATDATQSTQLTSPAVPPKIVVATLNAGETDMFCLRMPGVLKI